MPFRRLADLVAQLLVLGLEPLLLRTEGLNEVQQPLDHLPRLGGVTDLVKLLVVEHRVASVRQMERVGV